jgi:NitT/TauT family transport system substrate-binding protein
MMDGALGSRRRFLAAAAASWSAVAFGPQGVFAQTTRPLTPIAVNTTLSVDLLPFLYAIDQGMFAKAELDVSYSVVSSGALSMVAVLGGATQVGWSGLLAILTAYAKNIPVQLIAPGAEYLSSAPQTELFVTADSPLRGPKDLEGHTVGVAGLHDQSAIGVRAWVDGAGGDSTRVQFVEVPYSTMIAALDAKRVDAIVVFEPVRSAALAAHERSLGKPFDAFSKRFLSGAFFATRTWIAQNREAALRYGNVLRQSAEYCNAHYSDLIPLISSYTKIAPDVVRRANQLHFATSMVPEEIQPLIDVSVRYHEMPAAFAAQDAIIAGYGSRG